MAGELVLVSGASGYVGMEVIRQLLDGGYQVRGTVRSLKREAEVRETLKTAGAKNLEKLEFREADLTKDDGWKEAASGCTYVHHVASPFPAAVPKHEDELIIPAREGTLRILRASRDAGVKRVVLTSSFAAIGYGHKDLNMVLDEIVWTDINSEVGAYHKSKTIAERAAWDFVEKEGKGLELSVINPVGIFGPVHSKDFSTSIQIIEKLINGSLPMVPQLQFGIVDVRDVALLHLKAMTNPKAKGERFLAISGEPMTIQEISMALRERMGNRARKASTRVAPNFMLRIMSWFDPAVGLILPELGKNKKTNNGKARTLLDWTPIDRVDACVATAESLIQLKVVRV